MKNLKIKELNQTHKFQIIELQKEIRSEEKNQEKLLNSSEETIDSYFKEKGFILGIFDENELIGFSRIWYPTYEEVSQSYKEILKLDEDQISKIAFFRGSCIKKEYRGQKLQKRLFENAMQILQYLGFQYISAKIKSNNIASLKNLADLNFKNEGIILKDDIEYYLFRKKIN